MFKIEVFKDGKVTNFAEFPTEQMCLDWKEENANSGAFGKRQRWVIETELTQEEIASAIDSMFNSEENVTFYLLPDEFTHQITDITQELLIAAQKEESKESFVLVENLKAYIRWLNKKKIRDGVWNQQTFVNFLTSTTIAQAERALNQASWATYKGLVVQAAAFYTAEEITYIIGLVEQHEQKWQSVLGG